jgi:hypothetical protein
MKIVKGDRNAIVSFFSDLIFICRLAGSDRTGEWPLGKPIPNLYNRHVPWKMYMSNICLSQGDIFGLFLGSTVFGTVHLAAWNFVFPTPVESLLWKIAAVLCTTMGLIFGVCIGIWFAFIDSFYHIYNTLVVIYLFIFYVIPLIYVVCRLFLVVEIFRCLCFLPPSAYIATWARNVPHIA